MATKAGTKEKKTYKELTFYVEDFPGCCGIQVVGSFREEGGHYTYPNGMWGGGKWNPAKNKYVTAEEQAEAVYKKILKETECPCLTVSLVSRWNQTEGKNKEEGTAQLPALHDILIREGWQINQVFINPVHGDNEVTLFTKVFPERCEPAGKGEDWADEEVYEDEE